MFEFVKEGCPTGGACRHGADAATAYPVGKDGQRRRYSLPVCVDITTAVFVGVTAPPKCPHCGAVGRDDRTIRRFVHRSTGMPTCPVKVVPPLPKRIVKEAA